MDETSASRLVRRLARGEFYRRTAILELPPEWLGREAEVAARLGIDRADLPARILGQLRPGQRYLGLDADRLISRELGSLVDNTISIGPVILVANVDLMVSSLRVAERARFWETLRQAYRPLGGLLLTLPVANERLIPPPERERWIVEERLARWE